MRCFFIFSLALLLAACASSGALNGRKLNHTFSATRVIDLTHPLSERSPVWPGGIPFKKKRLVDYDQGYRIHSFTLQENVGTHLDAPSHFSRKGDTVDALDITSLIAPAVVINVQKRVRKNPDYELSSSDLIEWEEANGTVPENSLVILNTGWYKRAGSQSSYRNFDKKKAMHFPGYSGEVSELLVKRGVVGIGIDTMSLDRGISTDYRTHQVMFTANKYMVENLTNLDELPATGATVVVGVVPVEGGTQAQARVLAFLD